MAAYEHIRFDLRDGIARLTLHRPDKLNSFNQTMLLEVRDAIAATAEARARVLLLTGAGRGFCAGQDLGDRVGRAQRLEDLRRVGLRRAVRRDEERRETLSPARPLPHRLDGHSPARERVRDRGEHAGAVGDDHAQLELGRRRADG